MNCILLTPQILMKYSPWFRHKNECYIFLASNCSVYGIAKILPKQSHYIDFRLALERMLVLSTEGWECFFSQILENKQEFLEDARENKTTNKSKQP